MDFVDYFASELAWTRVAGDHVPPGGFDNARKLRALLAELQDLTMQIIDAGNPDR